ncbi:MAG: autotransporter assembly complex protein TamA [Pseudorhodobacter sp.]
MLKRFFPAGLGMTALVLTTAVPVLAVDEVSFDVRGGSEDLTDALRASSGVLSAQAEGNENPQDLLAAARAEYGQLLGTLYSMGHYSAVINVQVNGREAAEIPALNVPQRIDRIDIRVDPGPRFTFSEARISPLAQGTEIPKGFARGQTAESGVIRKTADAAIEGWREAGHAKAEISSQDLIADHRNATMAASLGVSAGPRLRFAPLRVEGEERMRPERIVKIAGLPAGETYSPEELKDAANRLRRTGVFRSVTLIEDDKITSPDLIGITAQVVEEKTRRYSYGIELASSEGAKISGYWMHRNLLGGAERLRIEGSIAQIGAKDSGADYSVGVSIDRPATPTRDTTANFLFEIGQTNEEDYSENFGRIGLGFTQYHSDTLTLRAGLGYEYSDVKDALGDTSYHTVSLPLGLTWDHRNSTSDATQGYFIEAEAKPFLGFRGTDSGLRFASDARAYYGFGEEDRVVLAGRVQLGGIFGADLGATPRDYLFYSGGGGTVRGQPYQSLSVNVLPGGLETGGNMFGAISAEIRTKITDSIGAVGFVDAGYVGVRGSGVNDTHAGAGLGLRYNTGFGPIRLDVATPISGDTGDGIQVYVGIGQAF